MPKIIITYLSGSKTTEPVMHEISESTRITFGKSESSTVVLDKDNDCFSTNHCSILYQENNFVSGDERTRKTGGHRRRNKIEYSGQ